MQFIKKIRNNEYAKVFIPIGLVVCLLAGLFLGLQLSLRVVESGSMCIPYGRLCEGWLSVDHAFNRTLHKGDIIIVQHVNPADLNTNYPNSDIIVYQKPTDPTDTPIVHRIVTSYEVNGTLFFQTKGDGNPYGEPESHWPNPVSHGNYDSNSIWLTGQGVPENLVLGKVVLRIPYFGWITLLINGTSLGLPLIIALILLFVILEFIVPLIKQKIKPHVDNQN